MTQKKETETQRLEKEFDAFDKSVKDLTMDNMNRAPMRESEEQTKMSSREKANSKDVYLTPKRRIGSRELFNERFRDEYNEKREMVKFIAENKEVIGESIDLWTKPFPGVPAEEWLVPVNTPVWGPRYLAEQIRRKYYHRLEMKQVDTGSDGMGKYYGTMAAESTIPRLTAEPVSTRKSIFMGASD